MFAIYRHDIQKWLTHENTWGESPRILDTVEEARRVLAGIKGKKTFPWEESYADYGLYIQIREVAIIPYVFEQGTSARRITIQFTSIENSEDDDARMVAEDNIEMLGLDQNDYCIEVKVLGVEALPERE